MKFWLVPFAVDVVQIAIFLIVVIGSLVSQLVKFLEERKAAQRRLENQPPIQDGQQPQQANPLEREIQDFLRRTIGGEPDNKTTTDEPFAAELVEPRPVPPRPRPAKRTASVKRQARPIPHRDERDSEFSAHESVSDHVARHLTPHAPTPALGQLVGQADERLEDRLQNVFDHRVGNLRAQSSSIAGTSISQGTDDAVWSTDRRRQRSPLASEISKMVSTPQSLAASFVLAEILKPPSDRWDTDDRLR